MSARRREQRKRRSDLGALGLVLVLLTGLIVAGTVWAISGSGGNHDVAAAAGRAAATKPSATLRILRPGGEIRRAGATTFRTARDGQTLREGDAVRSDQTGMLEVNYTDGSLTRLGASTEYTIERLTEEQGGRQTRGALTAGETWSRAAKVSETGSFEVRAGGTTAAVEGTAFAFSCAGPQSAQVCSIIDVVDFVSVTTKDGARASLTPASGVTSTGDVLGATRSYTREEIASSAFLMTNLKLDQLEGKGLGAGDLPPSATVPSVTPATGPTTTTTTTAPSADQVGVTQDLSPPPAPPSSTAPPPPPPPPSDPRCVAGGWTQLVGAAGQTFVDEQACSDFALAGGVFAVAGGGVFIVPLGSTVTLSGASDGACNTLEFGYSVQLDELTTSSAVVGSTRQGAPCGGSLGSGVLPTFNTAVLLRVFLQDDTCGSTRFASDGNHAAQMSPTTVAIMDAGGDCASQTSARPPDFESPVSNLDLVVTVTIDPPPAGG